MDLVGEVIQISTSKHSRDYLIRNNRQKRGGMTRHQNKESKALSVIKEEHNQINVLRIEQQVPQKKRQIR